MYTLKNKEVKTKKSHQCWGCGYTFGAGRIMHYSVCIDEYKDFSATYYCEICEAYLTKNYSNFEDGIGKGELRGEEDYNEFKKDYLCQERKVLIEKYSFIIALKRSAKEKGITVLNYNDI